MNIDFEDIIEVFIELAVPIYLICWVLHKLFGVHISFLK
jgi:hypothetical protein